MPPGRTIIAIPIIKYGTDNANYQTFDLFGDLKIISLFPNEENYINESRISEDIFHPQFVVLIFLKESHLFSRLSCT